MGLRELVETNVDSYLSFHKFKEPTKKTYDVTIYSVKEGSMLGEIKWYSGWRRYVYEPRNVILDTVCMLAIINYIDKLMEDRNNGSK